MHRLSTTGFAAAFILLTACASAPLTEQEKSVRILRKSDAEKGCKELGTVIASGLASLTDEGRESDLKRATVKAGGNTVTWNRQDENHTIYGTAYNCPQ